jgi:hypothetical protein
MAIQAHCRQPELEIRFAVANDHDFPSIKNGTYDRDRTADANGKPIVTGC